MRVFALAACATVLLASGQASMMVIALGLLFSAVTVFLLARQVAEQAVG
jgi:hypothetical protein